jgi:ribosomal protein L37AE/L43A
MTKPTQIRWSRRVLPAKIRRLYESDAQGMLDQDLLDDVGYGIYVRCRDILEVSEARQGRVKCQSCGNVIQRQQGEWVEYWGGGVLVGGENEELTCDQCGWQVTWGAYNTSVRGTGLIGDVVPIAAAFVERWPTTRTPQAKLILIDTLIHEFHVVQFGLGRPVGVNVIQGTTQQVEQLIADLAAPVLDRGMGASLKENL